VEVDFRFRFKAAQIGTDAWLSQYQTRRRRRKRKKKRMMRMMRRSTRRKRRVARR
jgi:hypothetical protein